MSVVFWLAQGYDKITGRAAEETLTIMKVTSPTGWGRRLFIVRENLPAVMVLVICLLISLLGWIALSQENKRNGQERFDLLVSDVIDRIRARLLQNEQIIAGGAGLFDASIEVDRDEWRVYTARLRLANTYPGILGVGFVKLIQPEELAAHVAKIRVEGFAQYAVWPPGDRSVYSAIVYIEPLSGRNVGALGYDMMSEPTRAKAMRRAAETGETAMSGKVKLVQEIQGKVQAGFLMYVPVYRKNMPLTTPVERMRALYGFSFSPYRVDDLMAGFMGQRAIELDLRVFDGETLSDETQMYNSADAVPGSDAAAVRAPIARPPMHLARRVIQAYGHSWTVEITGRPEFEARIASPLAPVVLPMGGGIGALLFLLMLSNNSQRERAQQLAREMTVEIRTSEEQLKASQERFDLAVRGSKDGIWDWNILTGETYYSLRFHELLGLAPGELGAAYTGFEQRLHPGDRDLAMLALQAHLDTGAEYDAEFRLQKRVQGAFEWRWFNARGLAVRDENDVPVRMAGSLTDVTERHRVVQMKTEFVSTVSHELRTPLTSICGALGLAVGGALGGVPETMQAMLATAHRNSLRLSHLIDDLLDIEKLEAGKIRFDLQIQVLMPLIDQAVEANRAYAQPLNVSLRVTERADDVLVRVDGSRLQQVLANLLSNAAKFSKAGEDVQITVRSHGKAVRVSVIDQGPGVPRAFRDRVFQKFSQADASDTREKTGTGLGLAVSKELIERMNGLIGFTSEEGEGACFYFELPQCDEVQTRYTGALHAGSPALSPDAPHLLVVEDEPDIAELLAFVLRHAGYGVDVAPSGSAALKCLAQQTYAAITLDLLLPDKSGVMLIREIRADPRTERLPIVVVSAYTTEGKLAIGAQFHAIDWMQKPFDENRLVRALQRAIDSGANMARGTDDLVVPIGPANGKCRVLHVEDDADLFGIVSAHVQDLADVSNARNLQQARDKLLHGSYDVVVLDIGLSDGLGWELLPHLKTLKLSPAVIVLSGAEVTPEQEATVSAILSKSAGSTDKLLALLRVLIADNPVPSNRS